MEIPPPGVIVGKITRFEVRDIDEVLDRLPTGQETSVASDKEGKHWVKRESNPDRALSLLSLRSGLDDFVDVLLHGGSSER